MSRIARQRLGAFLFLVLATTSACGYPTFSFDGGGGSDAGEVASSSSHATSASSSTSSGFTCASVDGVYGCCDDSGNLRYCNDGKTVVEQTCLFSCGWSPVGEYVCDQAVGADPSGTHPIACSN